VLAETWRMQRLFLVDCKEKKSRARLFWDGKDWTFAFCEETTAHLRCPHWS